MNASGLIRWSPCLLLSLALGSGCQRTLPHVGQRHAAPAANETPSVHPVPSNASPLLGSGDGWTAASPSDAVSANGTPLSSPANAAAGNNSDLVTAQFPSNGLPPAPSAAEITQTQFQAGGAGKEWEALHQRLAQQAAVNAALTQAVVDLQKQTETHHKDLVRLAEEMNARQARNDKVTEEILSLIEQMSQQAAAAGPQPAPGPAPAPPQGAARP